MERLAYSSIAAFLAHRRLLGEAATAHESIHPLSLRESEILQTMNQLMDSLTLEERSILLADGSSVDASSDEEGRLSGEARRRRARAELKLRRLLLAKGVLGE
jgi:hypothetical protein